jgi:hypothetical protein
MFTLRVVDAEPRAVAIGCQHSMLKVAQSLYFIVDRSIRSLPLPVPHQVDMPALRPRVGIDHLTDDMTTGALSQGLSAHLSTHALSRSGTDLIGPPYE